MKNYVITPAPLIGKMEMPPSKSCCHRELICAALSGGGVLHNVSYSEDILATLSALKSMGADFTKAGTDVVFHGFSPAKKPEVDCGESGSTLRFMIPIALALCGGGVFLGRGRLMQRPLEPYFEIFDKQGISYKRDKNALSLEGELKSGSFDLIGNISSQFITGLLLALPLVPGNSEIRVIDVLESRPYVNITTDVMRLYGAPVKHEEDYSKFYITGGRHYSPRIHTVEGDFSQAAFFLSAGALGGDVLCTGLNTASSQGDKAILDLLRRFGAKITFEGGGIRARGGDLKGIEFDASDIPDLVPALSVVAMFARGSTSIVNAARLRLKESDRLRAMSIELARLGADIEEGGDYLKIIGGAPLHSSVCNSHGDHRVAMALAIAGSKIKDGLTIKGGECVKKSLPDFWERYGALGGIFDERTMG